MPLGLRLMIFGGDRREVEAAGYLAALGHAVATFGGHTPGRWEAAPEALGDLLAQADAVIGPALGTNATGDGLYRPDPQGPLPIAADWLDYCRRDTAWLIGKAGPWLKSSAAERGLRLVTYADTDEFAILNAVPTAEGAIAEVGRLSGRTVWGEAVLVVGGGRCAQALVPRLAALGAAVTLAARNPVERARATTLGAQAVPLHALAARVGRFGLVFNTVPARILGRTELANLRAGAVVADLASAPGGVDFSAAEEIGVRAVLLPGIPGRLFPVTAGRIVATVVLDILNRSGRGGSSHAGAC